MQFCLVNRSAELIDFILAFRPYSHLLAKISIVLARPIYLIAGLLNWRVNRLESKLVRTYTYYNKQKSW